MVKAATVRRAAARRQVVLELEELGRHELVDGQRAKGAGHGTRRQVVLRDEWLATAELVHVGDVVNLIGTWAAGEKHTTPADNLLILHPDVLLSATAISGTSTCTRKPLVQALLRSSAADDGGSTEALVMGAMLHAVLQACLTGQGLPWAGLPPTNFARGFVEQQVHAHVAAHLEDIVGAGLETGRAAQQLMESAAPFGQFAQLYLAHPHGEIEVTIACDTRCRVPPRVRVKRVLEVEEDIWSPMYGLKGFVDVSVEVESLATPASYTSVMPLELKTGRAFAMLEHRAQTMLYMLMMSERYGVDCAAGLLYYSRTGELHRVRRVRNEVRALLIGRNELASYLARREDAPALPAVEGIPALLPRTIDDARTCSRCFVVDGCMLYRRAEDIVEDPEAPSAIADLYERKTAHLSDKHAAFFAHWERLLSLEEDDVVRFRRELWTMTGAAREHNGRALAGMQLVEGELAATPTDARRHVYRFVRAAGPARLADHAAALSNLLQVGDTVIVSVEPALPALAAGTLVELSSSAVTIALKRALDPALALAKAQNGAHPLFRIDRDDIGGGMARIRNSVARLFYAGGDALRRELVVDLRAPRFMELPDYVPLPAHLNDDQRRAMRHVLSARDYALVVGMPGTGKTTTIAELIQLLVRRGKTVLLASYTHSAVDTICRKLVDVDLLRLGSVEKIHPDVRAFAMPESSTAEELEARMTTPTVVATTCLSLPPLVRHAAARAGGLDVSLFSRLAEAHPTSQVYLTRQYRMNADVMALSNELVYDGRLRCGSDAVADLRLELPARSASLTAMHAGGACTECWLDRVLDPACRVVFLDTDRVPGRETRVGESLVQNEVEGALVAQLAAALVLGGTSASDIAVITPLRQQIRLLAAKLHGNSAIEILTADRAQGRDKAVVIISFVRSGEAGVGELLSDARRINVALTRAQRKLILVGSRSTLAEAPLLRKLFGVLDARGWCQTLPPDAHRTHHAPPGDENTRPASASPQAKAALKRTPRRSAPAHTAGARAILKDRPLLRDLVNDLA
ncbi:Dna2-domain-containing protein [Tilletiopsis washingtonensis]|uniref:DNA helicase n=1 Tax=Tilletiopsis washingtonensis TaxID=58919 RepID=A0A316Z4Z8_9BASI|nr:Dna2-domain-containing protein [Tilletiopsis washingtonensis]PWN96830.1 Dna2-domain-containing protein [Tilletiopsis washingtonensis]